MKIKPYLLWNKDNPDRIVKATVLQHYPDSGCEIIVRIYEPGTANSRHIDVLMALALKDDGVNLKVWEDEALTHTILLAGTKTFTPTGD